MAARTAADGKGVRRIARTAADGVGARVAGNAWGEEAAGDERAWLRGRLRTGNGCGELRGRLRTAADGVGAREWLEMGGEKKQPLVMSELGCADGCGREKGAENCADGCGWRGCNGVAGNYGCGEEAAGDERALAARTAADGKWVERIARTAADGVGAREWLEIGGEKKPLEISELGCADGCGRQMGAENCADGCGRRGCKAEMGAEKKPLEISERGCADGCGRRGCNGVAGNGWGEEAAGDQRAWVRGRLRTGNGCGELRGRLRTAWVQRSGWKLVERRRRWR